MTGTISIHAKSYHEAETILKEKYHAIRWEYIGILHDLFVFRIIE